jgi:predicted O-methyltransferase YrrM
MPMNDQELDRFLEQLYQFGLKNSMWNVRPQDGKFLQIMAATAGARRVLELGTSNGYSAIWICRGLRATGGKLTTVEINPSRAQMARENFAKAGISDLVEVIEGDAFKILPTLKGPFDLIFLDTEKRDYLKQFQLALPLLRPGGVFMAHNAVLMKDQMLDFLDRVQNHPELVTVIAQTSDDGFSVSYRKSPGDSAPHEFLKVKARREVSALQTALETYVLDEGCYPGIDREAPPERNDFPRLLNVLLGPPAPAGPGGRSAPYIKLRAEGVVVKTAQGYCQAAAKDLADPKIEKYYLDPWGNPYVYRANKGKPAQKHMKNPAKADLYSLGPDGVDQTIRGEAGDDIGNW